MTQEQLIQLIKANEIRLNRLGVAHLALFGSRARNDADADSDVDILIDLTARVDGNDAIGRGRAELAISGTLSDITGLEVSLVERRGLSESFAAKIRDDLLEVF